MFTLVTIAWVPFRAATTDGAARQIERVEFIAGFDAGLNNLRVFHWGPGTKYEGGGVVNCGRCEKCIRTMMALELGGKLSQCTTFDRPLESRRVAKLRVKPEIRSFYEESLEALCRQRGSAGPPASRQTWPPRSQVAPRLAQAFWHPAGKPACLELCSCSTKSYTITRQGT